MCNATPCGKIEYIKKNVKKNYDDCGRKKTTTTHPPNTTNNNKKRKKKTSKNIYGSPDTGTFEIGRASCRERVL